MINFIDHLQFCSCNSGCVGRGHSALLCPRAYTADKTALATIQKDMALYDFFFQYQVDLHDNLKMLYENY